MNLPFELYTDIKVALPLLDLIIYFAEKGDSYLKMYNRTLVKRFGKSEKTIQRWIKKLEDCGLITVELVKNKYRRIFFNVDVYKALTTSNDDQNVAVMSGANNEV